MKKSAHYKYKNCLRRSRNFVDQSKLDEQHEDLINGNQNRFWKSHKLLNGSKPSPSSRINGHTNDQTIADCFSESFKNVYNCTNPTQASYLKDRFSELYSGYVSDHLHDDLDQYYLKWPDMITVLSKLKTGKATATFIKAEHILLGSPKLATHLHILFNAMLQHAYVPVEFLNGVITPLIKDAEGDHCCTDNYRGLTLGVVFSYLFEHTLMLKTGHLLESDSLQFGYKKRHSTTHALYTLKTCIDYFTSRGSNVFCAFLDCTKGFDKVNHDGIFIKLIKRRVPLCILNLLIYWYSNLSSVCKWNNIKSGSFRVPSGVRQGGVLSPHLFALYVDDLITDLRNSGVGCHIIDLFLASIFYADDLALLAPCRSSLQTLLDICESYSREWCLNFNPKKSKVMVYGGHCDYTSLTLNGGILESVSEWKYLGLTLIASTNFKTCSRRPLTQFLRCANTILNAPSKPSEKIQMKLLYSNCVPVMTYGSEIVDYSSAEMYSLHVKINDAIRKIFSFNRWESVRYLRTDHGYLSIYEIFEQRRTVFMQRLATHRNVTLRSLYELTKPA